MSRNLTVGLLVVVVILLAAIVVLLATLVNQNSRRDVSASSTDAAFQTATGLLLIVDGCQRDYPTATGTTDMGPFVKCLKDRGYTFPTLAEVLK